jgi:hypothetical protein
VSPPPCPKADTVVYLQLASLPETRRFGLFGCQCLERVEVCLHGQLGPIRDPGYDPVRVRLEKSQIEVTGFGRLVTNFMWSGKIIVRQHRMTWKHDYVPISIRIQYLPSGKSGYVGRQLLWFPGVRAMTFFLSTFGSSLSLESTASQTTCHFPSCLCYYFFDAYCQSFLVLRFIPLLGLV